MMTMQPAHAVRPLGSDRRAELVMWLRKNAPTLQRDNLTPNEAAALATKHLMTRIGGGNIEEALTAIGVSLGPPQVPIPVRFERLPAPPKPTRDEGNDMPQPPPITATPAPKRAEPSNELVQMASTYAMLKTQIIDQSRAVSDALKFVQEAEKEHRAEQEKLNLLTREQIRLRTTIKEAMEL